MYFEETIKKYGNKKIDMYIDMDGVIADFEVGLAQDYDKKRPLISNIKQLEEISNLENIRLFILSVARMDVGITEKNNWLDINVPFIPKENRVLISREANDFVPAKELKSNYVQSLERNGRLIVIIDDDPLVLEEIKSNNEDVILYKDTIFVD